MRKKELLVLVLVFFTIAGVFALPGLKFSAGAGGYFTSDFGGGVELLETGEIWFIKHPYSGGGAFAFFDATFEELSLGIFGGSGTFKGEEGNTWQSDTSVMGLDIGLLGKYPFAINDELTVFPLLGITYRAMLSVKQKNGGYYRNPNGNKADPGDFSALWFKLGGRVDYYFTDANYLRGDVLYGWRVANRYEKNWLDDIKRADFDGKTLLGHGLEIKFAIGHRF
ncbi:MAG: hypothetical protein LBK66_06215 [Spirochaetaceae bacterium]|jgi:hypothetical protein|nr:hypothetical protein [Spirochaetaceae bacterium]